MKEKIWSVARITMGCLIALFGFTTVLPNVYDIKDTFSSLRTSVFSVWSVLTGISGIGILMRQNWARRLFIYLALFLIPLRLSSTREIVDGAIFVLVVLMIISFFLNKQIKAQFRGPRRS